MRILQRAEEIPPAVGRRALVPTMGALHEGHLSLIRKAKDLADEVLVTVFVNPTQFGANEDFARYPRDLEADADLAQKAGADLLFAPATQEIYPRKCTRLEVPEVTERWEGPLRPGHFSGVAGVVLILTHLTKPHIAIYGQKDLQQCLVIRRMVEDLRVPVELAFGVTIREADGLAMSSRNMYLSPEQRRIAGRIFEELTSAAAMTVEGSSVSEIQSRARKSLSDIGFDVEYFELVSLRNLEPLDCGTDDCAWIAACGIGQVRLIDNLIVRNASFRIV